MTDIKVDLSKFYDGFGIGNKIGRLVWNVTRLIFFRPFIPSFCNRWRILVLKCFGAQLDWTSTVYASVKIWAPWNLEMGAYATLGPEVDCYNQGKIVIGAHTTISQKSYLCASSHDITDPQFPLVLKPILIEQEAWIAADAFIGPGVTIGRGAVIAARSSVFENVEPWSVMRGNPAECVKKRVIKSK